MDAERASDLAGVPDAFQRLWTPHRMVYIDGENKPTDSSMESCPFCHAPGLGDVEGLIVARGRTCFVVMNLYPYNPGHLLVCPYRHVSMLTDLDTDETVEFTRAAQKAMRVLAGVSRPHGFNLGINQGSVAGAGIAAHLHQHVVPRWQGDSNFMPVVAQTKALPQLLSDARALIAARWAEDD